MLFPLVRMCVRHSVKYQDVAEMLKRAFVKAAEDTLLDEQAKISISKVSVMTGVNRREVTRLLGAPFELPEVKDVTSRVIGQWQVDEEFLTRAGQPAVLSVEGLDSQFFKLVRKVSSDIAPYTVLYDLERLGLISRSERGVKLLSRVYTTSPDQIEDGLVMMSEDVEDLIHSIEENCFHPSEIPNLHLKTEYTNVSAAHIAEVKEWLLHEGSAFHRKVRTYLADFDLDVRPELKSNNSGLRVAYGSFSVADSRQDSSTGEQE